MQTASKMNQKQSSASLQNKLNWTVPSNQVQRCKHAHVWPVKPKYQQCRAQYKHMKGIQLQNEDSGKYPVQQHEHTEMHKSYNGWSNSMDQTTSTTNMNTVSTANNMVQQPTYIVKQCKLNKTKCNCKTKISSIQNAQCKPQCHRKQVMTQALTQDCHQHSSKYMNAKYRQLRISSQWYKVKPKSWIRINKHSDIVPQWTQVKEQFQSVVVVYFSWNHENKINRNMIGAEAVDKLEQVKNKSKSNIIQHQAEA